MFKSFFIFASDNRSYLDLKNIVLELKLRNLPYFFLYTNSTVRLNPKGNLREFLYDSNTDLNNQAYFYESLQLGLPFRPDVVILTNENWEPEKNILLEFKVNGSLISCVENSSWLYNNIKTKLELKSRQTYPSNCIDVFFDHSNWCKETKKLAGWSDFKSVVVGNPKFDKVSLVGSEEENILIVYGSMEAEHHTKLLQIYSNIVSKVGKRWSVYYKPHPNEMREFPNDFAKVNLIIDEQDYLDRLSKTKYCVGLFTSVMYLPLANNKTVIYIDNRTSGVSEELELENFKGKEFNFWSGILGFSDFSEFVDFIDPSYIESTLERNKNLENLVKETLPVYDQELSFLGKRSDNSKLVSLYDEFNDGNAAKRIVNFFLG